MQNYVKICKLQKITFTNGIQVILNIFLKFVFANNYLILPLQYEVATFRKN